MMMEFIKDHYRFVISLIASLIFAITVILALNGMFDYITGDAEKIINLYVEQTDDEEVVKIKNDYGFIPSVSKSLFYQAFTFPDGTPFGYAFAKDVGNGVSDLFVANYGRFIPDELGIVTTTYDTSKSLFKRKLKVKNKEMKFNKLRLTENDTVDLNMFFGRNELYYGTFISASFNPEVIKLTGNRTYEAISEGETEIGMLYFDGKDTHTKKIKVVVKATK
ncbi:hypothetical protein AWH56_008845 [Anaerobacillus isosaccharinicus]|uniref:Uncharacterized protein n=1 Tax=Anaerobacillus isosaccharinicus TaxID=1532552 RepID=A0A1S2L3I3_9BACI|nr:hypothetical protein [Anaerobacillus isosaccharinicus]MBA5588921.1 hypothetical protein [Anaerobacillus isosaccharinicus]QOY37668.1 hypothetical protein AWH56_008845 [Anaerobacillus isosaccharinicus]